MGTRSTIAMKQEDGTFLSIYCQYDGYPSNNGNLLLLYYNNPETIKKLIDLGSLSCLGEFVGEKHDFNNHFNEHKNWCNAYGRDRGEIGTEASTAKTIVSLVKIMEEYLYVYQDNAWWWCGHEQDDLKLLTEEDCKKG